jgi:hypothetical protein
MPTSETTCYVAWNGYVFLFFSCLIIVLFFALFEFCDFVVVTGDFWNNPLSIGGIKTRIEHSVPGIYVKSLKIGSSVVEVSIRSVI